MSNNWTKTISKINKDRYQIPEGWDTKEQVAENLQCDPARVNDLLKPGIALGEIEKQDFPVWDDNRRMTTRVTCYRVPGKKKEDPRQPQAVSAKPSNEREARILAAIAKYPKYTSAAVIAKNMHRVSSAEVAFVLANMK